MTPIWPSLIIVLLLLMMSPMFLALIVLAGDSGCGVNTSSAMTGSTIANLIALLAIACGLHGHFPITRATPEEGYGILRRGLVSTTPSMLLYLGCFLLLAWQWLV